MKAWGLSPWGKEAGASSKPLISVQCYNAKVKVLGAIPPDAPRPNVFMVSTHTQICLPSQQLNVFPKSISMYYLIILHKKARMSLRSHKFQHPP